MAIRLDGIRWNKKFGFALKIIDEILKDGNINLDLKDRNAYSSAYFIGEEVAEVLGCTYWGFNGDGRDIYPAIVHSLLANGLKIKGFEDWTAPQIMAAFAAHLISSAEATIDELPPEGMDTFFNHRKWTRAEVVEECANLTTMALEVCYFGRMMINEDVAPDPEKVAAILKTYSSNRGLAGATVLHSKPGGAWDKKKIIQDIWASGKYDNRDLCAEEEYAATGYKGFSAARKALRNTDNPNPWPGKKKPSRC